MATCEGTDGGTADPTRGTSAVKSEFLLGVDIGTNSYMRY